MNGLFSSVSGGAAQELWLDKVTNNLANANTAGFKGDYPTFESRLVESSSTAARSRVTSSSVVLVDVKSGLDMTQGAIKLTGNPLDLAIEGKGYFVVATPEGDRYTRGGSFVLNSEGTLTTSQGYALQGEGGDIKIAGSDIIVSLDGEVVVDGNSAGTLKMVDVANEAQLSKEGDSLYSLPESAKVGALGDKRILQGHLEMSNVKVVTEMTRLINISRAYEAYQKVIGYMNDIHSKVVNEIGRPS